MEKSEYLKLPPHDCEAHGGKAASQTGYRRACLRCTLLFRGRRLSIYATSLARQLAHPTPKDVQG